MTQIDVDEDAIDELAALVKRAKRRWHDDGLRTEALADTIVFLEGLLDSCEGEEDDDEDGGMAVALEQRMAVAEAKLSALVTRLETMRPEAMKLYQENIESRLNALENRR
jgi:hypothetical protein